MVMECFKMAVLLGAGGICFGSFSRVLGGLW
jgi:hypothetical protein